MTNPSLHLDRVPSTDKPRAEYKVSLRTLTNMHPKPYTLNPKPYTLYPIP